MGQPSNAQQSPTRRFGRYLLAGAWLLLVPASIAHYLGELRLRSPAERFERDYLVDVRWPWVKAMGGEPAGDLASDVVVQAALQEAPGSVRLEELSPPLREAWVKSMSRRKEELRAARDLMLEAIAERPGWAFHLFLLGQTVAVGAKHPESSDLAVNPERWAKPLHRAAAAAPGVDAIWVALGEAYLENWPSLPPAMREEAPAVLRRAFLDPAFVSRDFLPATAVLGRSPAMSLLPDAVHLLDPAARALAREGDIPDAALLMMRMDKAEKKERATDLKKIEERYRLGDLDGLRAACLAWTSDHPVGDFDDRAGRAQAAAVLKLWPSDRPGSWRSDPRAEIVRFFLNGRESDVKGETLARALDSLSGVPDAVLARVKLLAGDREAAEELAGRSEEADALEWTPYFAELARFELKRGRAREARSALERVAPGAREECEVLLTHRDVARALGDGAELQLNQKLESVRIGSHAAEPDSGSHEATLSLCVDPEWSRGRILTVEIEVAAPAAVVYGWDGGHSETLSASESSSILRMPLPGFWGRRNFSVRAFAGGPIRELRAVVSKAGG